MSAALSPPFERGIGHYRWTPATLELQLDKTGVAIFVGDPRTSGFEMWQARVHPDDYDRVLLAFSTPTEAEEVYRLVMQDGTVRHVLSRVTELQLDPTTSETSADGVILDVTARLQSDAMLGPMLDSISDGFLMLDHDYRVIYSNREAEVILGPTAGSLRGRVLWDTFPDANDTFRSSYAKAMHDRVPVVFETYYPAPLAMWLEVRAQPSSDGILIFFQNVTQRHGQQEEREGLLRAEQQARAEAHDALQAAEHARQELAYQATHDTLTGLLNRGEFERLAVDRLAQLPHGRSPITVLFLDLDRFKLVNDSLGHAVGDSFLVECASRLARVVGHQGLAARLGGDEFVILAEGLSPEAVQAMCKRLLLAMREPAAVGGYTINSSVSIGIAASDGAGDASTLLRNADVALYRAKESGRDRFAWFDADAHHRLLERISLEGDLRTALDDGTIDVHFQPIFSLEDGGVRGAEALARWQLPSRGAISPATFIPLAEDAGLINKLGRQVVDIATTQAKNWTEIPDFKVWINFSGRQFSTSRVADDLLSGLSELGLSPNRIGVEVTETVLADESVAVNTLHDLASAGVEVAIDDFGTGYSSIARLSKLPISVLKIDRSFVSDIETRQGRATVDAIVRLAQALGMRTVAEGIETTSQLDLVREAGVTLASGYFLGRPAPAPMFEQHLTRF
jgi:diguanylate cyclase (GGDEF)-like protein/PAS domain S-box-containing protein